MIGANILGLWCAHPADISTEESARLCETILSEDEQARAGAFRFDRDRHAFIAAHVLLRMALSHYYPLEPKEWTFESNSYGKPFIDLKYGLRFNLSHASRLVTCVISPGGEVGVDVEAHLRSEEIVAIASSILSPLESLQMEALSDSGKLDRALTLWTLKEAFVKACGLGLSLPLQQISFLFGGEEEIRLELGPRVSDDSRSWQFGWLDHAEHRIAIVTQKRKDLRLQFYGARSLSSEPQCMQNLAIRWLPAA